MVGRRVEFAASKAQAWNHKWRRRIWIEFIQTIVAFGLGQQNFVTKTNVQGEVPHDLPIVLDEHSILETLRRASKRHVILP